MDLEPGIVVAERFRLVRPLGQGGMGAVWLAHHVSLDTPCAIKFIQDDAARSQELRARFEREAKIAAQLRSPHVVQILDHGAWQDTPYIAMEFLEGEDLAKRLRTRLRSGRLLEPHEVVALVAQVGRALARAHAAGLVHRDLKPANIFLCRDDDREVVKVLDFGVAKVTAMSAPTDADANTQTGAILGTPFYMSPEQARGHRNVDHRADLWALSVIVFQCLTGKLPFRGEALGDLLVKIIADPLPVPSASAPVPASFDAWWARAVDRDVTRRFQTAKELTEALGVALEVSFPTAMGVGTVVDLPARPGAVDRPPSALRPAEPGSASVEGADPAPAATPDEGTAADAAAAPISHSAAHLTPGPTMTPNPAAPVPEHTVPPALPLTSRMPLFVVAAAGLLVAGGLGTFVTFRSGPVTPTTAAPAVMPPASIVPVPAEPVAAPTASTPAATASPVAASASASVRVSTPAVPAVKAAAPHAPPPTAVKPRVDFGI